MADGRAIRLKEMAAGIDTHRVPPVGYLDGTDGSLGEGPWRVRTDEHGFIVTGNEVESTDDRLLFLGDSFVESIFCEEPRRFVSQIERGLRDAGMGKQCLNGGYSGATTLQLLNVFLNKAVPIVGIGGAVVLFVPQSDISIFFQAHSYWFPTDRYAPVVPHFEPTAEQLPHGRQAVAGVLELIALAAKRFGIHLIVVSAPHRHREPGSDAYLDRFLGPEQFASLRQRRVQFRAGIAEATERSGVTYVDADAAFLSRPELFYDELHLNDAGQDAFSDWLLPRLTQSLMQRAAP